MQELVRTVLIKGREEGQPEFIRCPREVGRSGHRHPGSCTPDTDPNLYNRPRGDRDDRGPGGEAVGFLFSDAPFADSVFRRKPGLDPDGGDDVYRE